VVGRRRKEARERSVCPLEPARQDKDADQAILIDRATLPRYADGARCRTASVSSWVSTITQATTLFTFEGGRLFTFEGGRPPHPDTIRQRFDRLAATAGLSRITSMTCGTRTPVAPSRLASTRRLSASGLDTQMSGTSCRPMRTSPKTMTETRPSRRPHS
jgi:hypothetical protein